MPQCESIELRGLYGHRKHRCPEAATETVAGRSLCWLHAGREVRIAQDGYTKTERAEGLHRRRFVDDK